MGTKKKKKIRIFKQIVNGSILLDELIVKHIPFIVFLFSLGVILIANRYHSERILRDIVNTQKEVRNLRSESISTAAELMNLSRPSEVSRRVKDYKLNLEESTTPPKILYVD